MKKKPFSLFYWPFVVFYPIRRPYYIAHTEPCLGTNAKSFLRFLLSIVSVIQYFFLVAVRLNDNSKNRLCAISKIRIWRIKCICWPMSDVYFYVFFDKCPSLRYVSHVIRRTSHNTRLHFSKGKKMLVILISVRRVGGFRLHDHTNSGRTTMSVKHYYTEKTGFIINGLGHVLFSPAGFVDVSLQQYGRSARFPYTSALVGYIHRFIDSAIRGESHIRARDSRNLVGRGRLLSSERARSPHHYTGDRCSFFISVQ